MRKKKIALPALLLVTMLAIMLLPVTGKADANDLLTVNGDGSSIVTVTVTAGVPFQLPIGLGNGLVVDGNLNISLLNMTLPVGSTGTTDNVLTGAGSAATTGAIMISEVGSYSGNIYLYDTVGAPLDLDVKGITLVVKAPLPNPPASSSPSSSEDNSPSPPPTYTITYNAGDGAYVQQHVSLLGWAGTTQGRLIRQVISPGYEANAQAQLLPFGPHYVIPYYDGYTLTGWKDAAGNTFPLGQTITMPAQNITLTAVWQPTAPAETPKVSLTVHANYVGANPVSTVLGPFAAGTTLRLDNVNLVREGYTLLGFAKAANATQAEYGIGESLTLKADMTLYAVWQKDVAPAASNSGGSGTGDEGTSGAPVISGAGGASGGDATGQTGGLPGIFWVVVSVVALGVVVGVVLVVRSRLTISGGTNIGGGVDESGNSNLGIITIGNANNYNNTTFQNCVNTTDSNASDNISDGLYRGGSGSTSDKPTLADMGKTGNQDVPPGSEGDNP